jgi:hypothetical protein
VTSLVSVKTSKIIVEVVGIQDFSNNMALCPQINTSVDEARFDPLESWDLKKDVFTIVDVEVERIIDQKLDKKVSMKPSAVDKCRSECILKTVCSHKI